LFEVGLATYRTASCSLLEVENEDKSFKAFNNTALKLNKIVRLGKF
jgi:hypothetical protein